MASWSMNLLVRSGSLVLRKSTRFSIEQRTPAIDGRNATTMEETK